MNSGVAFVGVIMMEQRKIKLLLIEDGISDAELVLHMLEKSDYISFQVDHVQRLSDAQAAIRAAGFDAVLLDLGLPDSQGLDTLERIKGQAPETAVVVMTGVTDQELALKGISLGAQDYLVKGQFDRTLLERSIQYSIERKRNAESLKKAKELSDAVNRINEVIFSTRNLDEIMQRVLVETAVTVGADFSVIFVPEGHQWIAQYICGLPDDVRNRIFSGDEVRYAMTAVRDRRIVVDNDVHSNEETKRIFAVQYGVKAVMVAPLFLENDVVASLGVYSRKEGRFFTEEQRDFMTKASATLTLAIKNSRLFADLERAREKTSFFSNTLEQSSQPFVAIKPDGTVFGYNRAFLELIGYSAEDVEVRRITDLIPPELQEQRESVLAKLDLTGKPQVHETELIRKDGTRVPIESKMHVARDASGNVNYYYSFVTDVTGRRRAQEALRRSEERFRKAFSDAPVGMVLINTKGNFLYANRAFQQITGYTEDELRQPDVTFKTFMHPDDIERSLYEVKRLLGGETPSFFLEKRYRKKNGHIVWVRTSATLRRDEEGRPLHIVAIVEDIHDRKHLEEKIRHLAHHDVLTGLPNRRLFQEVAAIELAQARRHARKLAVLYMDLDEFKDINDTFGHDAGDELLKDAARRLKSVVRTSDTVARIGGDEFNVLISDIAHPEYASEVANKILAAMRKPFMVAGHQLNTSTSIGISIFPDDSRKIEELLQYADIAMYYAKEHGRNKFHFYSPVINTRSRERTKIEKELRAAIEHDEFRLYYQPVVDLKTRQITVVEALLRWQRPKEGLLPPEKFFRIAEEVGLMPEIENWVLRRANRDIRAWVDQGLPPTCVSINLSTHQFQNPFFIDLVAELTQMPADSGRRPCLALEIPEAAVMENMEYSIRALEKLKAAGVPVSIDNFGTGYSSLTHLKRLQVQRLKLDKSFVQNVAKDEDQRKIVTAALQLAHSMDLKVIAGGVEADEQLDFLRSRECDEAQGNYFSRPLPAEDIKDLARAA